MFNYLPRQLVSERLRITKHQTYRFFGGCSRIRSDYLLDFLNQTRRGCQKLLTCIPSDLKTPDELAVILSGSEITTRELRAWTHRKQNPPPFFRVNKQFTLFRLSAMLDWLDAQSCPRHYYFGKLWYEHKREEGTIVAPLQPYVTYKIPIYQKWKQG